MINLSLTLETVSPLHIGGEVRQKTTATRPMLKTRNGLPYVPAPSIKGRLRHAVEALLLSQKQRVCTAPNPEHMCQSLTNNPDDYCAVCQLFGSPWKESALLFNRLEIPNDQTSTLLRAGTEAPNTVSRVGIRINRKRRAVQGDFLFDTELFEPGFQWKFSGEATYTGATLYEVAPLLLASGLVTMIGGSRSRGLGWGRLSIDVPDHEVDLADLWQNWINKHGA